MYKATLVLLILCFVLAAPGASSQPLTLPITLQNGLSGYLGIYPGSTDRNDFDIRMTQTPVDGQIALGLRHSVRCDGLPVANGGWRRIGWNLERLRPVKHVVRFEM